VSEASIDALATTGLLERTAGGVLAAEIHSFAYLACLLSMYDGHHGSEWGYAFTATPAGAPFAPELADATDRVRSAGLLVEHRPLFALSDAGRRILETLSRLKMLAPRLPYLSAATASAALLPLPSVRDALAHEPQLRAAMDSIGASELLDDAGVEIVRAQFDAVRDALAADGRSRAGLVVPAVVWLTYLADAVRRDEHAEAVG